MHIILYVLDALRADHLGCYGYERNTSPNIDSLAQQGVIFENSFTSTTWTRPVAASILTGAYPGVHRTKTRQDLFSTAMVRLPEILQRGGFKTAAFSTMGNIAGEIGFERGFDQYFNIFRDPAILEKRSRLGTNKEVLLHASEEEVALPWAEDINDFLFPWLTENRDESTFSFIWSIETHVPYTAPPAFRQFSDPSDERPNEGERDDVRNAGLADRQRIINLYDDVIAYNDHCLGELIDHLKMLDVFDDTMIIIIGDHGDGFYEHGFYTHGHAPYEELIHVPMVVKFPQDKHAGTRVQGLVELIDIFSTVAAAAQLDMSEAQFQQGRNLLPLIEGTKNDVREHAFSDTHILEVHNRYLSVRSKRWKYIRIERPARSGNAFLKTFQYIARQGMIFDILRSPRHFLNTYLDGGGNERLYDLDQDPEEQNDLAQQRTDILVQMRDVLDDQLAQNERVAEVVGEHEAGNYNESELLQQHLKMLGYME